MILIAHAAPPASEALRFGPHEAAAPGALRRFRFAASRMPHSARAFCSPAGAAIESGAALSIPAEIDPGLRDRECGPWSGQTLDHVAEAAPDRLAAWLDDPQGAAPGGESVIDLIGRGTAWLESQASLEGHVVAITHPPVIRAMLVAAAEAPPSLWFRLDIGFGTRSLLTRHAGRWRIGLMNSAL